MSVIALVGLINKWLHLLSIIGILGWTGFAALILIPAAKAGAEVSDIIQSLWKRLGRGLLLLWVVALLTGFYNLYLVSPSVNAWYQGLVGMKMGLAILMFLAMHYVVLRKPAPDRFLQEKRALLIVLLLVGVVIVGMSARLNISRIGPNGTGLKQSTSTH